MQQTGYEITSNEDEISLKLRRKTPKTGPCEEIEFYDQIEKVARILDVKAHENSRTRTRIRDI